MYMHVCVSCSWIEVGDNTLDMSAQDLCFGGDDMTCGLQVVSELLDVRVAVVEQWWPVFLHSAWEEAKSRRVPWVSSVVTTLHRLCYGPAVRDGDWKRVQDRLREKCQSQDVDFRDLGKPLRRRLSLEQDREVELLILL